MLGDILTLQQMDSSSECGRYKSLTFVDINMIKDYGWRHLFNQNENSVH